MKSYRFINKTFVRQQGHSDCGVACLSSLIAYYGGAQKKLEELRILSGTNIQGTTLLGLYEAGQKLGFDTKGCQADIQSLKEHPSPTILHVLIEGKLQHYIICYGFDPKRKSFLIGDPGKGVIYLTEEELMQIWQSKTLLTLDLNTEFEYAEDVRETKRKWFIESIREDKNLLIAGAFIGVVLAVLGLSMSVFSQKLIDHILPLGKIKELVVSLVLLTILLFIRASVGYMRGLLMARQSRDYNQRVIGNFFDKILYLPVSFFDQRKTGEMVARMNDASRLQRVVSHFVSNLGVDILLVFVSVLYLCWFNWEIACIAMVSIPVYILIAWRFNKTILHSQKEVMERYAFTESQYISSVQGIKAIKSAQKESFFSKITNSIYELYQQTIYGFAKVQLKVGWLMEVWNTVFSIGIISWGAYAVIQKQLTAGELMAILTIAMNIAPSVIRLSLSNIQLNEAKVAFDRMYEFISLDPETINTEKEFKEDIEGIELKDIGFRFPGRKATLQKLNLSIPQNGVVAIMGDSGTGKSTLLQILQKFYEVSEGDIIINGHYKLNEISTNRWRAKVGVVEQNVSLFAGSLLENIALSAEQSELEKVVQFCQKWGFHDYFMQFPQNYLTILGENGSNLSGGQKQLLAFARALFKSPQLLLLDEPTAALDQNTEQFVLGLLQKLKKDLKIIIVSHRTAPLTIADHIYQLKKGRLEEVVNT